MATATLLFPGCGQDLLLGRQNERAAMSVAASSSSGGGGSAGPGSSSASASTAGSGSGGSASTGTGGATCSDQQKNGNETDVDCGGATCLACGNGKQCGSHADCQNGNCWGGACEDGLLISQVQTRGDSGANDEFVELFNPTGAAVTFDATWVVKVRRASGGVATCASSVLATRFTGLGQIIPAHGHILYVNDTVPAYNGPTPGDGSYTIGVPDAAAVVLIHGNAFVDSLCFYDDQPTKDTLTMCPAAFPCEGAPVLNPASGTNNTDASMERLSATVFVSAVPSDPRNLSSPPTP